MKRTSTSKVIPATRLDADGQILGSSAAPAPAAAINIEDDDTMEAWPTTSTTTTTPRSCKRKNTGKKVVEEEALTTPKSPLTKPNEKEVKTSITGSTAATQFIPNFIPVFNGYHCHFLKRNYYRQLKIFSPAAIITKNDSVGIFEIAPQLRSSIYESVNEVLVELLLLPNSQILRNPFEMNTNDSAIFIRLSPNVQFYQQEAGQMPEKICKSQVQVGRCYRMRLAFTLKGGKLDRHGREISPMISVFQVLLLGNPTTMLEDEMPSTCILSDPIMINEEENIELDATN